MRTKSMLKNIESEARRCASGLTRRDLLERPLDFYEPDVLPVTQPIMSKHYRKTQWFGHLLFYSTPMSNQQWQSTEGNVTEMPVKYKSS